MEEEMPRSTTLLHSDVVVVGGGVAGVAAAIAAAKTGAKTTLVEAGPMFGGELLTGMCINGGLNARGQYVNGGVARELYDECAKMGGLIGPVHDFRLICYVVLDPEIVKIAIPTLLDRYGVSPLLYSFADDVVMEGNRVRGILVGSRDQRWLLTADFFIDCSGDGTVAVMAGASYELGDVNGTLQPLSIMYRMCGVENGPLLSFVRDHPENLALGESDYIRAGRTDAQLAEELYKQGEAAVFFKANGPLLQNAFRRGELFPTALIMLYPTSHARKEVCVNVTRVAENIDGTKTDQVSRVLPRLMQQVMISACFVKKNIPGFENAAISAIAPRIGIRETRRIVGEAKLTGDDARCARKREDGVAKGACHIDIHGAGQEQIRIPVGNGGSYDVPWGCLLPKNLSNVYIAGRCLSSDREGHGTGRNMGNCLGMGHAVGTAAALSVAGGLRDIRDLPVQRLRAVLKEQGAILDGVY
jgi:hypothetical protein